MPNFPLTTPPINQIPCRPSNCRLCQTHTWLLSWRLTVTTPCPFVFGVFLNAFVFFYSPRALDALKVDGRNSQAWSRISLNEVIKCLEDLIEYFAQPAEEVEHEEKQNYLKALRNRQDLFQEEVRSCPCIVLWLFHIGQEQIGSISGRGQILPIHGVLSCSSGTGRISFKKRSDPAHVLCCDFFQIGQEEAGSLLRPAHSLCCGCFTQHHLNLYKLKSTEKWKDSFIQQ